MLTDTHRTTTATARMPACLNINASIHSDADCAVKLQAR